MGIRILAPEVVTQIAAGEVVDRPASVAKELVENSIDARATHLRVQIRGGGKQLIRVSDNGTGIPPGEVELAFASHATSKLTTVQDLSQILTLGFRGEALSSIAAAADVEMLTRTADEDLGTYVHVRRGRVAVQEQRASPQGTRVTVNSLFRHLPARRKFLRADSTELNHIADLVTRYAMAYPSIRFDLEVDGKQRFSTTGQGSLLDVLVALYGLEMATKLLPLRDESSASTDGVQIGGYISPPNLHRTNRRYITFLLNGRWIQDGMLNHALEAPYEGTLPRGRRPIAVVELRLDPAHVDVNVHPTKREVRFQQPNRVFSIVERTVRETLVTRGTLPATARPARDRTFGPSLRPGLPQLKLTKLAIEAQRTADIPPPLPTEPPPHSLPVLRVIGQVSGSYILTEGPDGLYVVDQHAAHERVLFEQLLAQYEAKEPTSQTTLEATVIQLSPADAELLQDRLEVLQSLGFVLEPFGARLWRITSVPAGLPTEDLQGTISSVLAEQRGQDVSSPSSHDTQLLRSLACHGAARARKRMSLPEMQALTRALETSQMPLTCPHGRPTVIKFSTEDLAREFERS